MSLPPDLLNGLAASPLLWLAVTLVVFEAVDALSRRSGRHPLLHPVLWATPVLVAILLITRTRYPVYSEGTQLLSFLLGPATVSLAVPLWRHRATIRPMAKPLLAALAAGSITSLVCVVGVLALFGAPREIIAAAAPRSTTTPVAMAIARQLGGAPSLTAVIVLSSGILGAMVFMPLCRLIGVRDPRAQGFAAGVAAHGIGAARAVQVGELEGAFAGIGMAMNAVLTAVMLSLASGLF